LFWQNNLELRKFPEYKVFSFFVATEQKTHSLSTEKQALEAQPLTIDRSYPVALLGFGLCIYGVSFPREEVNRCGRIARREFSQAQPAEWLSEEQSGRREEKKKKNIRQVRGVAPGFVVAFLYQISA
jgi:hypothetical protein